MSGQRTGTDAGTDDDAGAGSAVRFIGEPLRRVLDGIEDDLLTAGLGLHGLRAEPPGFADPLQPTAQELRRRAIHGAYRGLVDVTDEGGFGRLYGPVGDLRVAGVEYLAAVRMPDGQGLTTVVLQVPADFDPARPCLVVVASSGSRGIYGALPTAGEWGLRNGCAVVHTDKGTGVGFFDLDSQTGYRIDLTATTDPDDPLVTFRPDPSPALDAFRASHPHRVAVKHAHSGTNVEKDWGRFVLQAAKAGLALLDREFPRADGGPRFTASSTTIIAAGVSNGGGAVLRAVEQDVEGLIAGAVVSEPNAQPQPVGDLQVRQGSRAPLTGAGLPLLDYVTLHYLLQPAAILAPADPSSPLAAINPAQRALWEQWTAGLARLGLVSGDSPAAQAADARGQLESAGLLPEALEAGPLNVQFGLWPAVAPTYASAHARLPVEAAPGGVSFAATDPAFQARALSAEELARMAADGSGVPPTAGLQLVADVPGTGGLFASLGQLETACYFRALVQGCWPGGAALEPDLQPLAARLAAGLDEVRMSAALRGTPVIVLHGRRDGLVPVNHTSRAYYGLHRQRGEDSVRYYEAEHGQHFDAFIPLLPGWNTSFVALQPLVVDAMERMYRHLTDSVPLPPSQVLRTRPRGVADGSVEPLQASHLGTLRDHPGADAVTFDGTTLGIPD